MFLKRKKVFANNDSSMNLECEELLFTVQYSYHFYPLRKIKLPSNHMDTGQLQNQIQNGQHLSAIMTFCHPSIMRKTYEQEEKAMHRDMFHMQTGEHLNSED